MESLIKEIKQKSELKDLPDSLVEKTLKSYLSKNKIHITDSSKERKIIIKDIRSELRKYAGQYVSISSIKKRTILISENKIYELLNEHTSTRERSVDYDQIKNIIQEINPKSILDLGCGLNPLAIAKKDIIYHAYDIKEEDLNIVREFFKKENIKGDVHNIDIREASNFPKIDLCIIFKVLDILGDNRNEIAKHLLSTIQTKNFLVSFATRTLSGKPMNSPYRRWFEKIIQCLKYHYEVKRMKQELVYLIRKS